MVMPISSLRSRPAGLLIWLGIVMGFVQLTSSPLLSQALACRQLSSIAMKLEGGISRGELIEKLEQAERTVLATPAEQQVACLKWIADLYRDVGSYHAERLYRQVVEMAPDNPEVLEAIARYYRTYRGSKGLYAEAEAYYLRAEQALEPALGKATNTEIRKFLKELRERILRGRIELNKREGLGLAISRRPGQKFGLYLGSRIDDGHFPVAHNDLATPANTLLHRDSRFNTGEILREQGFRRQRTWLRFRSGQRPYFDVAWSTVDGSNVIASQFQPVTFADLEVEEIELAAEDTVNLAPAADLLWRTELHHGRFDVDGPSEEIFDRVVASTTWTRNFGRVKANLQLLGAFASIDLQPAGTDEDRLAAANLRLLHFRPRKTTEKRFIDPRGYEYSVGYVTRTREFGEDVELVQETFFAGLKLTELIPRTDLHVLPNFFRNVARGKPDENSSNLEINVILTHRLIDRVNNLRIKQADRTLGFAQWAINLRLFEEVAFDVLEDFESRGFVASSFVEIFSGPTNLSTLILEAAYEERDYHRLAERHRLVRLGLRLGF